MEGHPAPYLKASLAMTVGPGLVGGGGGGDGRRRAAAMDPAGLVVDARATRSFDGGGVDGQGGGDGRADMRGEGASAGWVRRQALVAWTVQEVPALPGRRSGAEEEEEGVEEQIRQGVVRGAGWWRALAGARVAAGAGCGGVGPARGARAGSSPRCGVYLSRKVMVMY